MSGEMKQKIAAQVPKALAVEASNREAFAQRLEAEGEMLRELVELAKPALPVISTAIVIPGWGVLQGIRYRESELYLDSAGRFVRPFGKGSRDFPSWREAAEVVTLDVFSEQLSDALDRLINGRKTLRTEQASMRAKKLRALAVLLREL